MSVIIVIRGKTNPTLLILEKDLNSPGEQQSVYHPNPVPSKPPTGTTHVPSQQPENTQRHGSVTNTLGSLPAKLASKTRSSKSFLRH
ncbi:hypothetical protein ACTXT7_013122 [Hymenolepis weldensis]